MTISGNICGRFRRVPRQERPEPEEFELQPMVPRPAQTTGSETNDNANVIPVLPSQPRHQPQRQSPPQEPPRTPPRLREQIPPQQQPLTQPRSPQHTPPSHKPLTQPRSPQRTSPRQQQETSLQQQPQIQQRQQQQATTVRSGSPTITNWYRPDDIDR